MKSLMHYRSLNLFLVLSLCLIIAGCASAEKPVAAKEAPPAERPAAVSMSAGVTLESPPRPEPAPKPAETKPVEPAKPGPAIEPTPVKNPGGYISPEDAREIIRRAVAKTARSKSFAAEMLMEAEMFQEKVAFVFDLKKYENTFYVTGDIMGISIQSYSDGKVTVYKDLATQRWEVAQNEQENLTSVYEKLTGRFYMEYVIDAKSVGVQEIKNVPCHVLEANVSPGRLNEIVSKEALPLMEMAAMDFEKIMIKVWIGRDDELFYKALITLEATLNLDNMGLAGREDDENEPEKDIEDEEFPENMPKLTPDKEKVRTQPEKSRVIYTIEMNYRDYDKIAPIVIPPEAKKFLEGKKDDRPKSDIKPGAKPK